jgi:general secretion pathway protein A
MYTSFFGLSEKPFAITPNPRFLYMSEKHAEAMAHLTYGLTEAGGFVQLTGEVGMGKTTLVRTLLEQLPAHADVAVILNPRLSPLELLLTICEELGIFMGDANTRSLKDMVDELNSFLLTRHAGGRRVVVIVDEAQNLLPDTLEQVRLLTNLETATHKLMQIILVGQPELRELLARNDLRQLAQRITGRYHLASLDRDDTAAYVRHRLHVAGASREIFSEGALRAVYRYSNGVPRLINIICDRALLGAYTKGESEVSASVVRAAASEIAGSERRAAWWWSGGGVVAALLVAAFIWWQLHTAATPVAVTVVAAAVSTASASSSSEPAILDISAVLQTGTAATDTTAAFAALFSLWNIHLVPGATRACDQAVEQGLECIYQRGSWGLLRTLNRPAILQLTDDAGTAHQVAITFVDDAKAQLLLDGKSLDVTLASLSRYWNGDFLLLWSPKVSGQKALTPGSKSSEVRWLRSSLARWAQRAAPSKNATLYDDDLTMQVAAFQREHHLNADGIAGLQTQVALDAVAHVDNSPTLSMQYAESTPAPEAAR